MEGSAPKVLLLSKYRLIQCFYSAIIFNISRAQFTNLKLHAVAVGDKNKDEIFKTRILCAVLCSFYHLIIEVAQTNLNDLMLDTFSVYKNP